jgi:hypothetical protein
MLLAQRRDLLPNGGKRAVLDSAARLFGLFEQHVSAGRYFGLIRLAQENLFRAKPTLEYNRLMASTPRSSVFDRVLDPLTECLTPEAARRIADQRADEETQALFDELGDKANEGQLTAEDRATYDELRAAFHLITRLQAKARSLLSP